MVKLSKAPWSNCQDHYVQIVKTTMVKLSRPLCSNSQDHHHLLFAIRNYFDKVKLAPLTPQRGEFLRVGGMKRLFRVENSPPNLPVINLTQARNDGT